MIVLIDNYDSFSYNLYQLVGSIDPDIRVIRNDQITVEELEALKPEAIILSPGPGRPEDAGICIEVVQKLGSKISIHPQSRLFAGLEDGMQVGRYHSLSAEETTMPDELIVTARTEDGEIMAVEHRTSPVFGVQFHPESILTPDGKAILENFFRVFRETI